MLGQDYPPNHPIPKRPRPSALTLHSINEPSLRGEEDQDRGLDLISDRVRLLEQISRMNEEMRVNEACTTELVKESRKKDKKIRELQAALCSGQPTSSRNSGTPSVAINPSSLVCEVAQANLIGSASFDRLKFANIGNHTSSKDHMAEQGSVIGPLHRQTQSTHSLGSQSYSKMRTRGSLDSPSPISQDFH